MEQGIGYIIAGVIIICAFLIGKYVLPGTSNAVKQVLNVLSAYPMLMKWGMAACQYIKQYFDSMPGEEKNKKAAEIIMQIAAQAGINISEEQARAIAQAAYEAMKRGESDSVQKEQVTV